MKAMNNALFARVVGISGLCSVSIAPTLGQVAPPWMAAARTAYQHIVAFRFSEAHLCIQDMEQSKAPMPVALLLENYIDFLRAVLDDQAATDRYFHQKSAERIATVERLPSTSPWVRYAEAEMHFHRAVLWGRANHYLSAAQEARRVCSLLDENQRLFPHFALNRKTWSIVTAALGALPDEFRWVAEWLSGMEGSVGEGIRGLDELLASPDAEVRIFEEEIRIAAAFLRLNLWEDPEGAWNALQTPQWKPPHSPLAAYALAIVAMRSGRNDDAIALLEATPEGSVYHPFWQRHLLLGTLKLNRLDADADRPLRRFVRHYLGESGRWEACQKIAWHSLLQGNDTDYRTWMAHIRAAKKPRTEQDRAAWHEARQGPMPDRTLLRARLLFDGGYYARAHEILTQRSETEYTGDYALEYAYRRARTAHALKQWEEAEHYYRQVLARGAKSPLYYACQSALQLGLLYEHSGRYAQAKAAYQTCLRLSPSTYRIGLHAKAKAGLARLKGKSQRR